MKRLYKRNLNTNLSRRRFLRTALLGTAAAVLSACSRRIPSKTPFSFIMPSEIPSPTTMPSTPILSQIPDRPELRAFWVDAYHPGIKTPQEIDQLIQDMHTAKSNAVFVQVRKRGDAYYNHTIEPRAYELRNLPDFDPLADLIQKAHAANPPIEVHAWMVALPIALRSDTPYSPEHLFFKHGPDVPEEEQWISRSITGALAAENNYFLDPGHPQAAAYVVAVVLNLVRQYDVDGVHLDYIRYDGKQWGYNRIALKRFAALTGRTEIPPVDDPLWQQWRRDQVTALMRQVYLETIAIKPGIKVSAATIAWGAGPTSEAGWQSSRTMIDTFQDWLKWMEEGIIDLALPMNYDRESDLNQKSWFNQWIEWEKNHSAGRHLVIGIGAYLNGIEETIAQAQRALAPSSSGASTHGICFYSYASIDRFSSLPEKLFRALTSSQATDLPALFPTAVSTPEMPWKKPQTRQHGYIKGYALLADGRPADGAVATLTGPQTLRLTVSGTGFFGAARLLPGDYSITLKMGDQMLASSKVKVEAGQVTTVT